MADPGPTLGRFLVFQAGARIGETVPLAGIDRALIGRAGNADIRIPDQAVSSRHAEIVLNGTEFLIMDVGSRNGTFVNDSEVRTRLLSPGDRIRVGGSEILYCEERRNVEVAALSSTLLMRRIVSRRIEEEPDDYARRLEREKSEKMQASLRQLACLNIVSQKLVGGGREEPFPGIVEAVAGYVSADRACLAIRDKETGRFRFLATHGPIRRDVDKAEWLDSILKKIAIDGECELVLAPPETEKPAVEEIPGTYAVRTFMAAPIVHKGSILGALYLDTAGDPAEFNERNLEMLAVVGRLVGLALSKRATEERMVEMEKFHSLGLLVSGIVHQVRSPLTVILAGAQMALPRCEAGGDLRTAKTLQEIAAAARRIDDTIRNLLHFGRGPTGARTAFHLLEAVHSALALVQAEIHDAGVAIHLDLPEELILEGNRNGIEQVLLNIVHNALQALDGFRPDPEIRVSARLEAEEVRVTVHDNGPGIPAGIRDRIFEPLFTTKPEGKGTGLGLSVAIDIAQKCGGGIRLNADVPEGACFEIAFPLRAPEPPIEKKEQQQTEDERTSVLKL